MSKINKMPEVAKILGKELEEEFGIEGRIGNYKLIIHGLLYSSPCGWEFSNVKTLIKLLTGELKIEWIPKDGENVWLVSSHHIVPQLIPFYPDIFPYHKIGLKRGLITKTEEEAIEKMKELGWWE